jgi:hypothetical protein
MDDDLIPLELTTKLDSATASGVLRLSHAVGEILSDNKLPFFPNYTDHGARHITHLLNTITKQLIPQEIFSQFTAADATVLSSAALLHDLAMHLREEGFLQLIGGRSTHKPVPWFDVASPQRSADLPWPDEWTEFRSQIRRFSDHDFFLVLGQLPNPDDLKYWLEEDLPEDPLRWTKVDFLLIGEFIRRHHGRLAHEFALYGFPGLSSDEFPTLEHSLPKLADLIGLVARSHSLPLREAAAYLAYKHPKNLRPRDTLPIYHMVLLRIGDYLQLDSVRAPAILFKLRAPTIPLSIDAWNQHGAVADISYTLDDPVAIKIELNGTHSLITHLQLEYLIEGLQRELDISCAVLSENYGRVAEHNISQIRLAKLRVYSNHADFSLLNRLPYIPERIAFGADPKILSLMVQPIYGPFPEFGIRELLQNSVDAVLEREQYCANHNLSVEHRDVDVVVELYEDDGLVVTITDVGIGMTPEVVRDYFLRAGASFRDSRRWKQEYTDEEGASQIRRSGRFGVGVFAGFLLGQNMEITTRHITADYGLSFNAKNSSDVIELRKVDAPVGTTITIRLSEEISHDFVKQVWPRCAHWYALNDPKIVFRHKTPDSTNPLPQIMSVTTQQANGEVVDWNVFRPSGFASVSWTSNLRFGVGVSANEGEESIGTGNAKRRDETPFVYCNGFLIGSPTRDTGEARYSWQERKRPIRPSSYSWSKDRPFSPPSLLISDHEGSLPLTLRRDQLAGPLPFEDALAEDIVVDLLAWCLASAPAGPVWDSPSTTEYTATYPLVRTGANVGATFSWACSNAGAVLLDRFLLREMNITGLLGAATCSTGNGEMHTYRDDDKTYTTVGMEIRGGWPILKPKKLDGVLAFHLGHRKKSVTLYKDEDAISHQDLQSAMTESFVEHLGTARESPELVLRGAKILKVGPGGSAAEEVRAGEYVEARTKLSTLLEPAPKSTTYFAWGDERSSEALESRFVAELAIIPGEGKSSLSSAWSSIIGATVIPFNKKARGEMIRKASKSRSVADRIEKWINHLERTEYR